ncbi:hypothetical protein [Paenibacillus monticola]|uniref:DUF1002 domain-containing protein n=1 Tax=Paenibacillus monticola TaxID=2666075 RepID=A0A7X2H438_9BACL|nr:hypothetical protein [Paenibacillus monticola]MRN53187.1 hypothetical protein [Paenibacillus monticola]
MNHKVIFKSVALSVLLLSAVSGSVFAAEGSEAPKLTSAIAASSTGVIGIAISSPLELAKTYAPETVKRWETTLAKYDELIGVPLFIKATAALNNDSVTLTATPLTKDQLSAITTTITTTVPAVASVMVPTANVQQLIPAGALTLGTLKEGVTSAVDLEGKTTQSVAGTTPGKVDPSDIEFFEGQIKLSKAEQSKDAAAIKDSLSKLLELYKQQITKLEASK